MPVVQPGSNTQLFTPVCTTPVLPRKPGFGEEHSDRGGDANANGSYDLRYDEDGQDATLHGLLRRAERGVGRGGVFGVIAVYPVIGCVYRSDTPRAPVRPGPDSGAPG